MSGPLSGTSVVEAGLWIAGPAAGGMLADWGADVVKIEPLTGDPLRGMSNPARRVDVNPPFELANRAKRSIALDLANPDGYRVARQLIDAADVFITNLLPGAVERLHLTYEELKESNPGLVYCRVTGYGATGPDRDRQSFDAAAFWSRSGIMASMEEPGHEPPTPRGGVGDHPTAVAAVAGICAALLARTRTGRGQLVDTSLYRMGVYTMAWDMSMQLRVDTIAPQTNRRHMSNPLVNSYRAGDGRWIYLVNLQGDRYWPPFCRAIGREDLLLDARFADMRARRRNAEELIALLDAHLATRSRDEWGAALDREGVIWARVQTLPEVIDDPQAVHAGAFVHVPDGQAGDIRMVAPPAGFSDTPAEFRGTAPQFGEHTEEILLELGHDWDAITALKERGAIP